jgi:hypothetical protein
MVAGPELSLVIHNESVPPLPTAPLLRSASVLRHGQKIRRRSKANLSPSPPKPMIEPKPAHSGINNFPALIIRGQGSPCDLHSFSCFCRLKIEPEAGRAPLVLARFYPTLVGTEEPTAAGDRSQKCKSSGAGKSRTESRQQMLSKATGSV